MMYPLEGIKVLDFGVAVAMPLGGAMLADMGAEVIKVERIQGEAQRLGLPAGMDDFLDTKIPEQALDTPAWMTVNRGKKNLAIDIRTEKGKEIILKLVKGVDVILQSFRPGVAAKLGIDYESASKINPKIIYCSFSGYGETGPLAHRAGGDMWSQAMSGMISVIGNAGEGPLMIPFALSDITGGIMAAYAVMTALFVRERTGIGQEVTANNLVAALYLQLNGYAEYLTDGKMPYKTGRSYYFPPFGPIRAKDGDVMTIFGTGRSWPVFCQLVGLEHLAHDPRFETDEARMQHKQEVERILDEAFSKKTRVEWQQIFRDAKMRCDPCLTYEEVCANPQVQANEIIYTTHHPIRGETRMLGVPVKLKKTPGRPQGPSPLLGQHTKEILLDLGYTPEDVVKLVTEGVIMANQQIVDK